MPALAIRAAAAGIPLTQVPGSVSARGAALAAGVGTGRYTSLSDLPEPARGPLALPDAATADWYAVQAGRYRSLYPTLALLHRSDHQPEEDL